MNARQTTPWGREPLPPRILPRDAVPRPEPVEGRGAADLFMLPESAALLLALVASCEGRAPERVLSDAVAFYAEHVIGLPALADAQEFLQGRAAVASSPVLTPYGAARLAPDGAADDGRAAVAASALRAAPDDTPESEAGPGGHAEEVPSRCLGPP